MKGFERLFISKGIEEGLKKELLMAGIKIDTIKLVKRILLIALILSFFGLLFFSGDYLKGRSAVEFPLILFNGFIISYFASLGITVFFTYTWIMVRKNARKAKLEAILADYLQLVAANIGAGMPIDQALWYAVRERFDVLINEMEVCAKRSMAGEDLGEALIEFGEKYDSDLLKKSIVLLVEGMESGGELASLVNSIAWNVREIQIMNKDISSDVLTYVIFIGFASLAAAPLLFALSLRINIVMTSILGNIDIGGAASTGAGGFGGGFNPESLSKGLSATAFKNFAMASLGITAIMSAMIISTVTKGNVKAGIRLIPIFAVVAYLLFLGLSAALSVLFTGFT